MEEGESSAVSADTNGAITVTVSTVTETRELAALPTGLREVFVAVPRQDTQKFKCSWFKQGQKQAKHKVYFPFIDLLNIMNFALDNTYIKDLEGNIWRQNKGIPMGDPHSPGMTIITCAWMEQEWMQTIQKEEKKYFKTKRYMDDVICFYSKNDKWDHENFVKDLTKSECYMAPLKLTDGDEGTFLETSFEVTTGNRIRHWLN